MVLPVSEEMRKNIPLTKYQLLGHSSVEGVSFSSRVPSGRLLDAQKSVAEIGGDMKDIMTRVADIHVDHDFLKTYGLRVVAGRDFDADLASDSTEAFIVNEAAVSSIGWRSPEEAVGKKFHYGPRRGRIVGVVADFHFESLHQAIAPVVFLIPSNRINVVSVRLKEGALKGGIDFLENKWAQWRPGYPFTYYFVDENFDRQYKSEQRLGETVAYFAGLAILIACLGLHALATFTAQKRTKEIGIRKVMGASVSGMVVMLSASFTRYVVVANLLAWPIAYFATQRWLTLFAYHTEMDFRVLLLSGGVALVIALLTVSYRAYQAAAANPVRALRYE